MNLDDHDAKATIPTGVRPTPQLPPMERQMLVLRVADAGVGFDVEQMHKSSESNGFGLFSVSERIQLIGGTVHIESQPGRGTVVSILLPVASTPL